MVGVVVVVEGEGEGLQRGNIGIGGMWGGGWKGLSASGGWGAWCLYAGVVGVGVAMWGIVVERIEREVRRWVWRGRSAVGRGSLAVGVIGEGLD